MNNTTTFSDDVDGHHRTLEMCLRAAGTLLGVVIVVSNTVFVLSLTIQKKRDSTVRKSTQLLVVSSSHCCILSGIVMIANSIASPYLPTTLGSAFSPLCSLWAALQLTTAVLDLLHLNVIAGDHDYVITKLGSSVSALVVRVTIASLWIYFVFVTLISLAFNSRDGGGGLWCSYVVGLNRYYLLALLAHAALGSVCSVAVLVGIRRTLDLHQRQIQVTNTITYKNLVFETKMARLSLVAYGLSVLAWTPLTVYGVVSHAGGMSSSSSRSAAYSVDRIVYLVGCLSYLKMFVFVAGDKEIRDDVERVVCSILLSAHPIFEEMKNCF